MSSKEIENVLTEAKDFIKLFSNKLMGNELNDSAKQVFFLDNQQKVKLIMESLTNLESTLSSLGIDVLDEDDQKYYDLCVTLMNKLTKTLTDYKKSYTEVKPDVTVEETTAIVTEETVKNAAQTNSSTKQLIKDMNELNEKANIAQMQEFTHAILVGKKFTYINAATAQELNVTINQIADANPNEKISVYEVDFKPVPLKQKTIYTV